MFRPNFIVAISCTMLLIGCTSQKPVLDSTSPPIEATTPLEGTPVAIAWNNDTQLMMGVDTGAVQSSLMFSPAVESLNYRIRGKGMMRHAYIPISLKQGAPPIENKQDVVMVEQAPYDGLIGWKSIRKYVWNINFPQAKHRFFNKLPKHIKKWNAIKLVPNSDYPQLNDSLKRRIILDTGAPHAVYISKKRWNAIKLAYPDAFVSVYSGYSPAAGGFYAHECMHVHSFELGSLKLKNVLLCESFANPNVIGIPEDIDIILGIGALADREFWIDGPGNTLYFSSKTYATPPPQMLNIMGGTFIPNSDGSGPMKAYVAKWSPAWDNGLRTGDTLVSINGRKKPYQDLIDYITTQHGAKAHIIILRNGKQHHIHWEVPDAPPAGEYYPTPEAITEEEFEKHLKQLNSLESQTN